MRVSHVHRRHSLGLVQTQAQFRLGLFGEEDCIWLVGINILGWAGFAALSPEEGLPERHSYLGGSSSLEAGARDC